MPKTLPVELVANEVPPGPKDVGPVKPDYIVVGVLPMVTYPWFGTKKDEALVEPVVVRPARLIDPLAVDTTLPPTCEKLIVILWAAAAPGSITAASASEMRRRRI